MSTVTRTASAGRASAAAAAEKKKKVLLGILLVLLIAVLAFELPRVMGRSSAPPVEETTPPTLVTDQVAGAQETATAADATSAQTGAAATQAAAPTDPAATAAAAATATPAKPVVLAFRKLPARDPFLPLLGQELKVVAGVGGTAVADPNPPVEAPAKQEKASAPPTEPTTVPETPVVPDVRPATEAPTGIKGPAETPVAPSKPEKTPAVVPAKVKPDVAVVYANGKKQAVGVDQFFKAGDLWFQLLAVGPKTMKLSVVGGGFAGGKQAITIPRDRPITLVNTATGVEYTLRFTKATTGIPTTSVADPNAETEAPAASETTETSPADETTSVDGSEPTTTSSGS